MAKAATKRRVYELPADMVDGIQNFARQIGRAEVDVVRLWLRGGLDSLETGEDLERRAIADLKTRPYAEVLKMVAGHRQIIEIDKRPDGALIKCADGHSFGLLQSEMRHACASSRVAVDA